MGEYPPPWKMWRKLNEKWKDICSFININHYNYFITDCFRSWKWHIFQNDSRFKICRSNAYHVPYAFTYSGIGILCGRFQTKNILFSGQVFKRIYYCYLPCRYTLYNGTSQLHRRFSGYHGSNLQQYRYANL